MVQQAHYPHFGMTWNCPKLIVKATLLEYFIHPMHIQEVINLENTEKASLVLGGGAFLKD
jgi:hypothetical protein